MSSNQTPGVPDGWEVEHVNRIGEDGEHCIDDKGEPFLLRYRTAGRVCIIRKIEKPAKYRPFKDAEEYLPHFDRTLMTTDRGGAVRAIECNDSGVWIGPGSILLKYDQLFRDGFRFFDDGTPFGAKIDE